MRHHSILVLILFYSLLGCAKPPETSNGLADILFALDHVQVPAVFTVVDASKQVQLDAVETTATTNISCTKLGAFYWEIGDGTGALGYSSVNGSVNQTSTLLIASASKWIWGAYVLEKVGTPGVNEQFYLRMQSGYDNVADNKCNVTTVTSCFTNGPGRDGTNNNNYQYVSDENKFYYNGGHFQAYAALNPSSLSPALTSYDRTQLTSEIATVVLGGTNPDFFYATPQLAGGVQTTAQVYAIFLRRILNSNLVMRSYLGADTVPTLPALHPSQALYSPFTTGINKEDVHYSYAHWLEDSPQSDGAFSSPGKFGFYPWIDSGVTTYGIIARYSTSALAYAESVYCGRLLRTAYATGVAQ
ncbi:hypothetical protein EHQ53_08675 [Leptospira langatensis]|uniref:Class A beta-lactamase-related serine hydrolase n=1 Tax=Leptospira langatensis TaxID=2484983 RepID=A0A5F1ZV83_9LEPT|nr:hypothetical protein [Leptospira langatensis]TGK01297.1 hypothetical protein EHO57_10195 [Leptospira langatensis]TGL42449.1 hypothetical protein EHQ53_08675 [Leptospira langatensis]